MPEFPVTVSYSDANKPDWIKVIKEDPDADFSLTITLESYDKIRFDEENVEGLYVDLPSAFSGMGLTVSDVNALIAFMRFSSPRVTVVLNGTGFLVFELVLPQGVSVYQIIDAATGQPVDFNFNELRNSVITVVQFSSPVELQLLVSNVVNIMSQAVNIIISIMITMQVIRMIIDFMVRLPREVGT